MNIEYSGIGKDDVFEIFIEKQDRQTSKRLLISTGKIYRFDQILTAINQLKSSISNYVHDSFQKSCGIDLQSDSLLDNGIVCKVLSSESPGWKQGKLEIQIKFEFIPDMESSEDSENVKHKQADCESELDELRKVI
jgi:hypothetical protein